MSVAAVMTQGASPPTVEKKSTFSFFQTLVLVVVLFFGTGYVIDRMHPRTPIKSAIAGLIRMVPFLAPFVLLDDGPAISEGPCECECKEDGTAEAVVDGVKVDALNHEFGS
jgi:hypothetical protein